MKDRFRLTRPKLKLSENDIESAVLDTLRMRHLYPLRLQSGKFPLKDNRWIKIGEPGIPDYCVPRFFVEVKAPGKTLSEVQRQKIDFLEQHWDLKTAVVSSLEELLSWLAHHPQL